MHRGMTAPAGTDSTHPTVDDVEFRALYKKTKYVVETADGWGLVITRYRPVPQPFPQPLHARSKEAVGIRRQIQRRHPGLVRVRF